MVTVGIQPWGESLAELTDAARRAEDAGAQIAWVSELHRSAPVSAAAVLVATQQITVATGITLAFVRSPLTLALEALDLDELGAGRFVLGLGTGVKALNERWHGVPFAAPARHLRETVEALRTIWSGLAAGTDITYEGDIVSVDIRGLRLPRGVPRADIPIVIAAVGPHMLSLAGSHGDGWISHELCTPSYVATDAAPRVGSPRGATPGLSVSVCCALDDDRRVARRAVAAHIAFYATVRTYAEFFASQGFASEQKAIADGFREGLRADELSSCVSDTMIDAFGVTGGVDEVAERIAAYEHSVDSVKLSVPTHNRTATEIRASQNALIEKIRHLTEGKEPAHGTSH